MKRCEHCGAAGGDLQQRGCRLGDPCLLCPSCRADVERDPMECVCFGLGVYMDHAAGERIPSECATHHLGLSDTNDCAYEITDKLRALATVGAILWPGGNPDHEWTPETIEEVARAVDFLRPSRKGA
jgi:hypothetical protein